ncbi:MAG: arylamine N-acetyltransferase [Pirellulales bacterium]|nr:arylamine N-acetyltransferase [Pirellulales bacterium]
MPIETTTSPLKTPPTDSRAARQFLQYFGLIESQCVDGMSAHGPDIAGQIARRYADTVPDDSAQLLALSAVARAFSTLPYENLTRIIRYSQDRLFPFRTPETVVADHIQHGTGGTCFSLTAALLHVVRWLGFDAEPLLADRNYGPNTHSALLVAIDGQPHLLDPGYLINRPVALTEIEHRGEQQLNTDFNRILLRRDRGDDRVQLLTKSSGQADASYRLTFKTTPADTGEFLDAWQTSFSSEILHKPLLTKVSAGQQWFLNTRRLQLRGRDGTVKQQLNDQQLFDEIVGRFGLSPRVVRQALQILHRQGDLPKTATCEHSGLGVLPAFAMSKGAGDQEPNDG